MSAVPVRVLCLSNYPADLIEGWVAGQPVDVTIGDHPLSPGHLGELVRDADIIIGDAARRAPLTAEVIDQMTRCRLVIHPAVGLDGVIDLPAARAHAIVVENAPGYNAAAVADWVLMAMLNLLRDGVGADQELRTRGWRARELGHELGAMKVGIVGFGAIGGMVAARVHGFGGSVQYADPYATGAPDWAVRTDLDTVVSTSDILTLHVPLVDSTRHLINASTLATMKPGSYLINAARGGLVDEAALVAAIQSGHLAGVALDVFDPEPIGPGNPLLSLPQTYLSAHIAASTHQARQRVRTLVGARLRSAVEEILAGEKHS